MSAAFLPPCFAFLPSPACSGRTIVGLAVYLGFWPMWGWGQLPQLPPLPGSSGPLDPLPTEVGPIDLGPAEPIPAEPGPMELGPGNQFGTPQGSLLAPDLEAFVRRNLLSITIQEGFANQWFNTQIVEDGPVQECILGANVTGTQSTRAQTHLDLVDSPASARMFVHLTGQTSNQVISLTPQARINSQGFYRFQLSKQLEFDGQLVGTRAPSARLEARQANRMAFTPVTGIPLVGPLANRMALYAAEQQRPLAERIAAFKVTEQMAPRFNDPIDAQIAKLNQQLTATEPQRTVWLEEFGIEPSVRTTNDHLQFGLAYSQQLFQPTTQVPVSWPDSPLLVVIDQELVNRVLGDLLSSGQMIPDTAIDHLLERVQRDPQSLLVPVQSTADVPAKPVFSTLRLYGSVPLQFQFQQGHAVLTMQCEFIPLLGAEISPRRIVIEIQATVSSDELTLSPRLLELEPVVPAEPLAPNLLADLAESVLRQQVIQRLEPLRFPAVIPLPVAENGPEALRLTEIRFDERKLLLRYEPLNQ